MYHIINIKWCIRNFIGNFIKIVFKIIIMEFEHVGNEFYITQFLNFFGHYY